MGNGSVAAPVGPAYDTWGAIVEKVTDHWKLLGLVVLASESLLVYWFSIAQDPLERVLAGFVFMATMAGLLFVVGSILKARPTPVGASKADPEQWNRGAEGSGADASSDVDWNRSGDLFWLGNDLMWATDVLLRGGKAKDIQLSLKQAVHHARQLGFENSEVDYLSGEASQAVERPESYWTRKSRDQLAQCTRRLANRIGDTAAFVQGNSFRGWADGADPHA